ncbi:MAG: flagellar motor switch protein FliN [Phycisphaerales bacterium]|nr:flagellar motor switch protein FliN [Phycisphaerales bacterium]
MDDNVDAGSPEEPVSSAADETPNASEEIEPEAGESEQVDEHDETENAALAAAKAAIAGLSLGDFGGFSDDTPSSEPDIPSSSGPDVSGASPFDLPDFGMSSGVAVPQGMDILSDVNLHVTIELGRTRMQLDEVLKMTPGAVVELDKLAGDPVDVFVNERHVARGEVLVLNDNFCVRINEIIELDDATNEFLAA